MLVTLDFETYYDKDYTLRKLSTSEYIRSDLFEAISCSIKIGKNKPFCYFGDDIKKALAKVDWNNAILLAHHTHFDGLILTHHFKHTPKYYACTLSMARALHPKAERNDLASVAIHYDKTNKLAMPDFKGKHLKDLTKDEIKAIRLYNNGDVESTYEVYQEMLKGFPVTELDLIDITVRMFTEPVLRVDLKKAKTELQREQDAKAKAIETSGVDIGVLSSNSKFVAALEALGVDVPTKDSPTVKLEDGTPKQIPAVAKSDEALQALLTHPGPKVVALVEGRLAAKSTISESRAKRLIDHGTGHKLPIYLNYAMAHTLRWSGGDKLNPQNFKQKKKVGGDLQSCILAPVGQEIVIVDSSQIEARVLAWMAEEDWILEAFRNSRDLYCEFGIDVYGRTITKADEEERFVCKTGILGLGYQTGGPKLQVTLLNKSIEQGMTPVRLPIDICYKIVNAYRTKCKKITELWKFSNDQIIGSMLTGRELEYKCLRITEGKIHLPNGLALLYPGLDADIINTGFNFPETIRNASYLSARSRSKIYGGLVVENFVQALARIIVADKMREIAQRYRVTIMKHDDIAFLAPKKEAAKALDWAIEVMSIPPVWAPDLPLSAEGVNAGYYAK